MTKKVKRLVRRPYQLPMSNTAGTPESENACFKAGLIDEALGSFVLAEGAGPSLLIYRAKRQGATETFCLRTKLIKRATGSSLICVTLLTASEFPNRNSNSNHVQLRTVRNYDVRSRHVYGGEIPIVRFIT
jgi:hypothetical protein